MTCFDKISPSGLTGRKLLFHASITPSVCWLLYCLAVKIQVVEDGLQPLPKSTHAQQSSLQQSLMDAVTIRSHLEWTQNNTHVPVRIPNHCHHRASLSSSSSSSLSSSPSVWVLSSTLSTMSAKWHDTDRASMGEYLATSYFYEWLCHRTVHAILIWKRATSRSRKWKTLRLESLHREKLLDAT